MISNFLSLKYKFKQNDLEEENLNEETMAAANFKPRKMEEGFRNVHNN